LLAVIERPAAYHPERIKPGRQVSAQELLDYCKERLVDYKVPRKIEFLESLPKTGPGKIDKLKLRGLR